MNLEYLPNKRSILRYLLYTGSMDPPPSLLIGAGKGGCWIIFDIFMENSMERKTFCPGAVFEKLTGSFNFNNFISFLELLLFFSGIFLLLLK